MASLLLGLFACTRSAIISYKNKRSTPSEERQHAPHGETLREKASKKIHGEGANPSQLGDPISLKAETSDYIPTEGQQGAESQEKAVPQNEGYGSKGGQGDKLREKATEMFHGKDVNPSMLGDPISLKAEASDWEAKEGEEGAQKRRGSKL